MDAKGKQNMVRSIVKTEQDFESDDEYDDDESVEEDDGSFQKKKSLNLGGVGGSVRSGGGTRGCRVDECTDDLGDARPYHKRHKVCEFHSKAQVVLLDGITQRFCQQCSRFHELKEFDAAKRSCRRRLAGHNERRRKSSAESQGESSSHEEGGPSGQCGHTNDRGRIKENSAHKHFKII